MTEKRYYYKDPLATAWMAKHFGMQIFTWGFDAIDDVNAIARDTVFIPDAPLYQIHPKSLHLLVPQLGDLVTYKLGVVGCVGIPYTDGPVGVWWAGSTGQDPLNGSERIIQRDGIPFHWPESDQS